MPPDTSHEEWEELAAAHALHALDAADDERFMTHVAGCSRCRDALRDFDLVASQLGWLADERDDEGDVPPWQDLRAGVVGVQASTPPGDTPVDELAARRGRSARRRLLAAAAAAVVVAAGVSTWQLSRGTSSNNQVAGCERQVGCHVVPLKTSTGVDADIDVVVRDGAAQVIPLHIAAPASTKMYVLWQRGNGKAPVALVSFRSTNRPTARVALTLPYSDTSYFAVSIEPAGPLPKQPSTVVAVGTKT